MSLLPPLLLMFTAAMALVEIESGHSGEDAS